MRMLGLGHDVVDVAAFAEQLREPGSRMFGLFSPREVRQAAMRGKAKNDGEAVHLAAKWAGKEAVLKAWEAALGDMPSPYTLDDFPWNGIEVLDDSRGRPHVALTVDVERELRSSLPPSAGAGMGSAAAGGPQWQISLSHDGSIASAVAILVDPS